MDFGFLMGLGCIAYMALCFAGGWVGTSDAVCRQQEPDDINDTVLTYGMLEEMED